MAGRKDSDGLAVLKIQYIKIIYLEIPIPDPTHVPDVGSHVSSTGSHVPVFFFWNTTYRFDYQATYFKEIKFLNVSTGHAIYEKKGKLRTWIEGMAHAPVS